MFCMYIFKIQPWLFPKYILQLIKHSLGGLITNKLLLAEMS